MLQISTTKATGSIALKKDCKFMGYSFHRFLMQKGFFRNIFREWKKLLRTNKAGF